jgi:hypothetical protein
MRTLRVVVIVAALALVPQFAAAHGQSEVAVTGHPHSDGPIEIKGTDFGPGEVVQLELRKQGEPSVTLGAAPVGADGSFAITLHVPSSVQPGLYELVAVTGNETTSAEATILALPGTDAASGGTATNEEVSNDRPTGETVGLAIVTALLALLGGAIVLIERRQAARPLGES